LAERSQQLLFTVLPETGAVDQVKGDRRATLLGEAGDLETRFRALRGEGGNQAGEVQDPAAVALEDLCQVKVRSLNRPADLSCAVIQDVGGTEAVAGIGDVDLVAVAPRIALRNVHAFILNVAAA